MNDLTLFNNTQLTKNLNHQAVAKVQEYLPELEEKTRVFDRSNSQTTLSMNTLTLLNGQSPMRMMRQIMAEVEKRKLALSEAQYKHAKTQEEISVLCGKKSTEKIEAKIRMKSVTLSTLENKINGSFKDIATLIDAYNNIKATHNIDEWDEETFEREEKKHHVRFGFDLLYRNLVELGRAKEATIQYLQQYGVHPQVAIMEVSKYISDVNNRMQQPGVIIHSNDLEEFLDSMSNKYYKNADETAERLFGKSDVANPEYMLRIEK